MVGGCAARAVHLNAVVSAPRTTLRTVAREAGSVRTISFIGRQTPTVGTLTSNVRGGRGAFSNANSQTGCQPSLAWLGGGALTNDG